MGAALIVMVREGLEAALIVSIILAYLRRLGRRDQMPSVWLGTIGAVAASAAVGGIVFAVGGEFVGRAEAVFEGVISLTAVAVLTWMVFWMRRQAARIKSEIQEKVDSALVGAGIGTAGLAFVMVLREGIETALFLFGAESATGGPVGFFVGATLGLVIAVAIGFVLYGGSVRLNLRTFFRVTGGLLLVVAAGLLAFGVHELIEARVLPGRGAVAFNMEGALPDDSGLGAILKAIFGYHAEAFLLEVVAWVTYLVVAGYMFFRPMTLPRPATTPSSVTAQSS